MQDIVQGMWIGTELSIMEQLSIQSFLKNNHEYHLYVYGDVKNIPDGAVIRDANRILPASRIFTYQNGDGRGSYAGFANFFRYRLLRIEGGWWADTDVICLKPLRFDGNNVFASEWKDASQTSVIASSGTIKTTKESLFSIFCDEFCQRQDTQSLQWGITGPKLVQKAIDVLDLRANLQPPAVFSPVVYSNVRDIVSDAVDMDAKLANSFAIHLWQEMWRRNGIDKNAVYPKGCLYEKLKVKYL